MGFLHSGHSLNTRSAFLHVLGDALSSLGVLVGAAVMYFTGWAWVDPIISIAISAVIVVGGWRVLREAVDVLLETVPPHVDVAGVEKALGCIPRVTAVHDLHIWTVGSGMVALSAHLVVDEPSACENDTILVAAKRALVERFGIDHSTLQIESQGYRHGSRLAGPCASSPVRTVGVPARSPGTGLRPTADRVSAESLFNLLGQFFDGGEVLDLYAGTGALAFEALSRGASRGCCRPGSRGGEAGRRMRGRCSSRGPSSCSGCRWPGPSRASPPTGVARAGVADPPYAVEAVADVVRGVGEGALLVEGGTLVIEHGKREVRSRAAGRAAPDGGAKVRGHRGQSLPGCNGSLTVPRRSDDAPGCQWPPPSTPAPSTR